MIKNGLETQYFALLMDAINNGEINANRTGVSTKTIFNKGITHDMRDGFPIITGKEVFFNKGIAEYEWIIQGLTHTTYLKANGIHWWDQYADKNGYLGKTYGYQLRSYNGNFDQMDYIHRQLRMGSRRAHATFWNPSDLETMELPPCYTGFTFRRVGDYLDMTIQFRSSDLFLGLPYDMIFAACMLIDVAAFNELKPRYLGFQITDAHVYSNHFDQVHEYLGSKTYPLPRYRRDEKGKIEILNYEHGPFIPAKLNN